MSPARVLSDLAAGGWQVRVDGHDLVVTGPKVPPALRAALTEHKAALLAHLAGQPIPEASEAASAPPGVQAAPQGPVWPAIGARVQTPDGPGLVWQVIRQPIRDMAAHVRVQLDGETVLRWYWPEALAPLGSPVPPASLMETESP